MNKNELYLCIASGPSLSQYQIEYCAERKEKFTTIVVNDNYKLAPWAEHLYAADEGWWNVHLKESQLQQFKGKKWIPNKKEFAEENGLHCIECFHKPGLGINGVINCGRNSGFQAINLAYHLGAKKIILIGYDMKIGGDGKQHWFGDHPSTLRNNSAYQKWLEYFDILQKGLVKRNVRVVNCSLDTALRSFTISTLEREIE